jgi:hypothetical protein
MTNLLEPWVLLRLVAGLVAVLLFARAAVTSQRVLRRFDARRATEGQLALEKQLELSATFSRVAAVVQVSTFVLTALAADRLSHGVRGAMCAYGVFSSHEWGFRSLAATGVLAIAAGILTEVYAFDARVRSLDLVRPLAVASCILLPLSVADLAIATKFFLGLDLNVVASCCSIQLDAVASAREGASPAGPRLLATALAVVGTVAAVAAAMVAARSPSRRKVIAAGVITVAALPGALAASVLEVAPHAFEVPTHVCPFCLLRTDAFAIGYPLYGALLLAVVAGGGAAASALLSHGHAARDALAGFAAKRLRVGAAAWGLALAVAAFPIVRYTIVAGGASLFP